MNANEIARLLAVQSFQLAAVIVVVGVLTATLGRRRPHLAYALWSVVLVKCFTPPWLTSPTSAFGRWQQRATAENNAVASSAPGRPMTTPGGDDSALLDALRKLNEPAAEPPIAAVPAIHEKVPPRRWRATPGQIVALWTGGGLAMALWLVVKALRLARELRRHTLATSPELEQLVADQAAQLGLRRAVRVVVSPGGLGPAAVGGPQPTIILPDDLVASAEPAALAAFVAHELVHLRRGDFWVGLCQLVGQIVWWFHPLVWWANRQLRRARERACDAEVLAAGLSRPADYARALVTALDWRRRWQPLGLLPGVRPWDVTSARLALVMRPDGRHRRRAPWWAVLLAAALAVTTLPGAAPPEDPPAKDVPLTFNLGKLVVGFARNAHEPPQPSPRHQAAAAKLADLGAQIVWGPLDHLGGKGPFGYQIHCYLQGDRRIGDDWLELLEQLDSLESISTSSTAISPEQLAHWVALPTVQRLWLPEARDEYLAALANVCPEKKLTLILDGQTKPLPSLAKLTGVEQLMITLPGRETWAAVQGLKDLHILTVQLNKPIAGMFDDLAKFSGLKRLQLMIAGNVPLAELAALGQLTQLERLGLHIGYAGTGGGTNPMPETTAGVDFSWVEKLTALKHLETGFSNGDSGTRIGPELTRPLANLPSLRGAMLTEPTDEALAALGQSKSLTALSLFCPQNALSTAALAGIAELKSLTRLKVVGSSVGDDVLRAWGSLTGLEYLESTHGAIVTDAGLLGLKGLTKMRRLTLMGENQFTDAGMAALAGMTQLELLQISAPQVTDRGVAALAGKNRLDHVAISQSQIGDDGLAILARLPQLRELTLNKSQATGAGLAALPDKNVLEQLSLNDCPVDDAGAAQIARARGLRGLHLGHTKLTDEGLRALAPLAALEHLSIDHTQIGDGAIGLLATWPKLSIVSAVETQVTKEAAEEFNAQRGPRVRLNIEVSFRLGAFTMSDVFDD